MESSAVRGDEMGAIDERGKWFGVLRWQLFGIWLGCVVLPGQLAGQVNQLWLANGDAGLAEVAGWGDGSIVMRQAGGQLTLRAPDVIAWGKWQGGPRTPVIMLRDGSQLAAQVLEVADESLRGAAALWGDVEVARRRVRGVLLVPAAGQRLRAEQILQIQTPLSADRLWLVGGDWLDGQLVSLTTSPELSGEVTLELAGRPEPLRVPLERIWAISLADDGSEVLVDESAEVWSLAFGEGSRLKLMRWEFVGDRWTGYLAGGGTLGLEGDAAARLLTRLQRMSVVPRGGDDLLQSQPLQEGQVGWLTDDWVSTASVRPEGGPLRVAGEWFPEGRGVVSGSTLVFRVPEDAKSLRWLVGLDSASARSHARVRLYLADEQGQWGAEPVWQGDLWRDRSPLAGRWELGEARFVAANVQGADDLDQAALVDWLQLMAVPASEDPGEGPN